MDGEYWMEGTYHILSRDMNNERPIFPTVDMSLCSLTEDTSVYNYRKNFAGKVGVFLNLKFHKTTSVEKCYCLGSYDFEKPYRV